jgi:hypothetical protein
MKQLNLFQDELDLYEKEWQDMPEFIMIPEVPILTIKISFKTKDDIEQFEKLINQKIYFNRENYWYPKLNRSAFSNQIYSDES